MKLCTKLELQQRFSPQYLNAVEKVKIWNRYFLNKAFFALILAIKINHSASQRGLLKK